MTVHRLTSLATGPATGQLIVAAQVLAPTLAALQQSAGDDGAHEGLVLWVGRTVEASSLVVGAITPRTNHGWGHVFMDELAVSAASRAARSAGLGVIAQVHSHPGRDTRHSDGDDQLVLMPFEGMFSLVVAAYGTGSLFPKEGAGLHQYQDGRWVYITNDAMTVVPAVLATGGK